MSLTLVISPLHCRHVHLLYFRVLVDMPQRDICKLRSICPDISCHLDTLKWTHQRCTPRLSTCAVARKSPLGEKVKLVAIELVLNASTSRPVGMSKVRIVESREVAMSQRESGEKTCVVSSSFKLRTRVRHLQHPESVP